MIKSALSALNELKKITTISQEPPVSTLGIQTSFDRKNPLLSGEIWLKGRRTDDGAENLWRIYDNLYDLNDFAKTHPGGSDWINLTKGTDITEAFEVHHINQKAHTLLPQFFARKASKKRNYPFTFNEDGFYKTLRRKIAHQLSRTPSGKQKKTELITDALLLTYVTLAVLSAYFYNFYLAAVCGINLALVVTAAHNFFHQKDNFRMYYFDLSLMSSREWRISHVLSHHLYTNTVNDLEVAMPEPFMNYHPVKSKNLIIRYASWVYGPLIIYPLAFFGLALKMTILAWRDGRAFSLTKLLPFIVPTLMFMVTGQLVNVLFIYVWILLTGGFYFTLVGLNAAHHHPDIFHDGDAARPKEELDFGIHQLDAVADRKDINSCLFLVLTNFGDHALHHLFPTLDHALLPDLYPTFLETCDEFGIDWKLTTQFELFKGQHRQLAKIEPNRNRPKALKKLSR